MFSLRDKGNTWEVVEFKEIDVYFRGVELYFRLSAFLLGLVLYSAAIYIRNKSEERVKSALFLVIAAGLVLRLLCAADPFLHPWDERLHALVAKHLMDHPLIPTLYAEALLEYRPESWVDNHIWLHKQPLPLWCMALAMKIGGVNEFVLRLPSVLLSTLAIFFTYLLGSRLFSDRVGFWAAFFHSVNGFVIEITAGRIATDHVDVFFFFFIELGVLLAVWDMKRSETGKSDLFPAFLTGMAIGAAILCKWLPALIVLPVYAVLNWRQKGLAIRLLVVLTATALVALPWQVYAALRFPREYWLEQGYNLMHVTETLGSHAGDWWFHLDKARIIWNELVYLPVLWLMWRLIQGDTDRRLLALAIWIGGPYLFFSAVQTKMPGYLLFTAPAFFLLISLFLLRADRLKLKKLDVVLRIAFIALAIRYCVERVKPLQSHGPEYALREKIRELENLAQTTPQAVIFNLPPALETMFYTDVPAYEKMPTRADIRSLLDRGYRVYVVDDQNVPEDIRTDTRVNLLKF